MVNGVPRKTEALYDLSRSTEKPNETAPIATPPATPSTAARTRVVCCRSSLLARGSVRGGARERKTSSAQLATGTKKSRQSQGLYPASYRRRRVIETPIQRKGSVQIASASQNQDGAAGAIFVRSFHTGFR